MISMGYMDKDGFIIHLAGLDRYMSVDETMSLGHIFSETNSDTVGCF